MTALERRYWPRQGKHADSGHDLGVMGGLAALSLDALSSVAYGPETMVMQLLAGGVAALSWTLPITLVITAMLVLLVISYRQVIAAHPDGGGAYAVSKAQLGRWAALLAKLATDDPGLEDVLNQIETRAAVELAKLGRRPAA